MSFNIESIGYNNIVIANKVKQSVEIERAFVFFSNFDKNKHVNKLIIKVFDYFYKTQNPKPKN